MSMRIMGVKAPEWLMECLNKLDGRITNLKAGFDTWIGLANASLATYDSRISEMESHDKAINSAQAATVIRMDRVQSQLMGTDRELFKAILRLDGIADSVNLVRETAKSADADLYEMLVTTRKEMAGLLTRHIELTEALQKYLAVEFRVAEGKEMEIIVKPAVKALTVAVPVGSVPGLENVVADAIRNPMPATLSDIRESLGHEPKPRKKR